MLTIAVLITWLAAGYRIVLSLSQPRTLWRTSFTAVMVTVAIAFTLYDFRVPIDQHLGVPALAGLLSRLVISVGVGFLLIYLHFLGGKDVPVRSLVVYAVITLAVLLTMLIAWDLGSFRERELADLLVSPSASVALYCLSFWSFLAMALSLTVRTCLGRWRTVRHQDPGREVSLLLTATGAGVGLVVLALWSASLIFASTGFDGSRLNEMGDRLLPIAAGLVAIGVICLLVVPYLVSLVVTWRRWRALRPLWVALVDRYPQVHLDVQPRGGLLTRLQFRLERMIIETLDALRVAPVAVLPDGGRGVEAVARSLVEEAVTEGDVRAAELLDHSKSRDADVDQLVMLAGVFERLHRAAA
jgi:hypothetical protein